MTNEEALKAVAEVRRIGFTWRDGYTTPETALARIRAVVDGRLPLPDSETEWQWGNWLPREERTLKADSEADARRTLAEDGWALRKRRAPGPWIEVSS